MRVGFFQQNRISEVKAFTRKLYTRLFSEPPLKWSFVCFANHYRKLALSEVASRSFRSGWMEAPPA